MNKTVSPKEVKGFSIKIRSVNSNRLLGTLTSEDFNLDPNYTVFFNIKNTDGLNPGQYYKIQMAYINNENIVGYYSTVGVVKYTTEPEVIIQNMDDAYINMHQYQYIGSYNQINGDKTEKVYSYKFDLYDRNLNLVETSDWQIHNSENDTELYESIDEWIFSRDLDINKIYYLEYTIITTNKLQYSSGKYRIMQKKSIDPEIKADLIPSLNFENGYVDLTLIGQKDDHGVEYAATGSFRILRASQEDNYTTWDEILKFALHGQQPSRWMWRDFTVKQGVSYKYALQQFNDAGLNSNRIESEEIYIDFEHAFLFDGYKQLKIKYNPKISTFKNDLLETKIDTIGGKYPFIFRNGNVCYKEFPISGLISCQLDEEFLFVDELKSFDGTSNLTGENIASEREFKLKVLEWLNDGNPKLFRSPTEGNYIVRLLNVSLTPNDTVGRMLHTFNCVAYEVADFNYKNLIFYNFIQVNEFDNKQLRWETIQLDKKGIGSAENILNHEAVSLRFEGMVPGDKLELQIYEDRNRNKTQILDLTIGITGSYTIDLSSGVIIKSVRFKGSRDSINNDWKIVQHQGTLTYGFYSATQNRFNKIIDIDIANVPLQQFIGEYNNIIDEITDIKTTIQECYFINCSLREIVPITYNEDKKSYYQRNKELNNFDYYVLYLVKDERNNPKYYYDASKDKVYPLDQYSSEIVFNGNQMDLTKTKGFSVKSPKDLKSLQTGIGVMTEISYLKQILTYNIEIDHGEELNRYHELIEKGKELEKSYHLLHDAIYGENGLTEEEIKEQNLRSNYEKLYDEYIKELEKSLKEEEEEQGDVPHV